MADDSARPEPVPARLVVPRRGRPGATLAAVAARVGVSRTTVSNAYNRPDQLSAELRQRILDAAADLGYPGPNPVARSLRTQQADAVGLIFADRLEYAFRDPAAVEYVGGLASACTERGRSLLMVPAGRDHVATVLRAAVDGFVVSALSAGDELLAAVLSRPQPAVVVDAPLGLAGVGFVGIDDRAGAALIGAHVAALGHRRIGVVAVRRNEDVAAAPVPAPLADRVAAGAVAHPVRQQRLLGLLDTVPADASVLVSERPANSREEGARGAAALLDAAPELTAVLCLSDITALGALDELQARGRTGVTVTGFDDVPAAAAAGLTTVRQPLAGKGRAAIDLLLDARPRPVRRLLPVELVVRGSSGPPG